MDVTRRRRTYKAAGSLFGQQYLRLVQWAPYHPPNLHDGISAVHATRRARTDRISFGTILAANVNIAR